MKYVIAFLGVVALLALLCLIATYPLMWAINWLFAPSFLLHIFGVSHLDFWRTFVLAFVTGWLFKSSSSKESK